MSADNEANQDDRKTSKKQADEAILRYARYTAPAMLAVLGSAGFGTPVAAQTTPPA